MNKKNKYIDYILSDFVTPFFLKYLPSIYDDKENIKVRFNDNVLASKQRIYSNSKKKTIYYDTIGKLTKYRKCWKRTGGITKTNEC